MLYLSLYFKVKRADYYRLLQEVRERGAWEAWLEFFLDGVAETAEQAFTTATSIVQLFKIDREKIANTGERSSSVLRVHELLQTSPFITAPKAVEKTRLTMPTINAILDSLQRLGIIEEITGRKRGRVYVYRTYMNLLSEGVQPI